MLTLYLWTNYHLCSILKASRKTGAITHVVAEVLSRSSGCVTGSNNASGMEVLSSTQEETQTFSQTGVPACAGLRSFAFIYASAF